MGDEYRKYILERRNDYVGRRMRAKMIARERRRKFIVKTITGFMLVTALSVSFIESINFAKGNVTEVKGFSSSVNAEELDDLKAYAVDKLPNDDSVYPYYEHEVPSEEVYINPDVTTTPENEVVETEEQQLIRKYCDIFEVKYDVVYPVIAKLTSNFTDPEYLENYNIEGSTMKGVFVQCTSKEEAILLRVRAISQVPENYGLTAEQLASDVDYISPLDYTHQVGYFANVLGCDACMVDAICHCETHYESGVAATHNNPSGIRFSYGWAKFPNITAGIIEQCCETKKHELKGRTTVAAVGAIHAPESDAEINKYWVDNVTEQYMYNMEHYDELFVNEEEPGFKFS